jgi:hypothetical protein
MEWLFTRDFSGTSFLIELLSDFRVKYKCGKMVFHDYIKPEVEGLQKIPNFY